MPGTALPDRTAEWLAASPADTPARLSSSARARTTSPPRSSRWTMSSSCPQAQESATTIVPRTVPGPRAWPPRRTLVHRTPRVHVELSEHGPPAQRPPARVQWLLVTLSLPHRQFFVVKALEPPRHSSSTASRSDQDWSSSGQSARAITSCAASARSAVASTMTAMFQTACSALTAPGRRSGLPQRPAYRQERARALSPELRDEAVQDRLIGFAAAALRTRSILALPSLMNSPSHR